MPVHDPHDLNPAFSAFFNSGDAQALAALYERYAVFHTPSGPVAGREAIRTQYAAMLTQSPKIDAHTRQILTSGGIALITTDWTFTQGPASSTGVSVEVIRQQPDGTWRYVIDEPRLLR